MVAISSSLCWSLISQNNSFMVKRGGRKPVTGSIRFSTEKGNLKSLSTYKYSGIANAKTVDVISQGKSITFITSVPSKSHTPVKSVASIPLNKCYRTSVNKVVKKQNKRRDLQADAEKKYSAVYSGVKVLKELRKGKISSTGRN